MDTLEDAERCVKYLHHSTFQGRIITVEKAKRRRARTPTPGEYLGLSIGQGNGAIEETMIEMDTAREDPLTTHHIGMAGTVMRGLLTIHRIMVQVAIGGNVLYLLNIPPIKGDWDLVWGSAPSG
eukprot:Gb_18913 [translate_table: standard]